MAYTKHTWSTGDLVTATDANHWETQYDCVFDTSAKTPTAAWTWQLAVGATSTDGLALETTTAATAGAQKYSPRMRLKGKGWKTNATAASQDVDFAWEVRPVQGAAAPTGQLVWSASINGGAYSDLLTLASDGLLTITKVDSLPFSGGQSLIGSTADVLSLRRGTNAQALHIHGTYTDASNYNRLAISHNNSGGAEVMVRQAGTGGAYQLSLGTTGLAEIRLVTNNSDRWYVTSAGNLTTPVDNSLDIGASGATRPKTAHLGTSVVIAQGTITASTPAWNNTSTWNNSGVTFTGWLMNITDTASAAGSLLADWQVGGSSKVAFSKAGAVTAASTLTVNAGGAVIKKASGAILEVNTGVARGSGNVYISISDPTGVKGLIGYSSAVSDTFVVANDLNAAMYFATNGNIGVRIETTGALKFPYYGAGTLETDASGNVTATSDARMKTAVQPFTAGLRQILRVQPVSFRWRKRSGMDTRRRYTGFLAHNVERALGATSGVTVNQKTGLRSLSDKALIGALVNAVRELHAEVETLKAAPAAA
jgi:hypothetical protein